MTKPRIRHLALSFAAPTLLAADASSRTLTGTVLPYGVAGYTSVGKVSVAAGAIALPAADKLDRVKLNVDHDNGRPIGYATAATETPDGLDMSFHIGATPAGDAALLEASERLRDALSVELVDVEFSENADDSGAYAVVAGRLVSVAQCATPAFADARISNIAAGHTPAPNERHDDMTDTATTTEAAAVPVVEVATTPAPTVAAGAAGAPRDLRPTSSAPKLAATQRLASLLCSVAQGQPRMAELTAELADVVYSEAADIRAPEYAGELWSGASFQRRIWPLLNHANLSSMKGTGWRWGVTPEVDTYAGDKADIPSNVPTTLPAEWTAERIAGGHDIDRAYFDFGDTEFIQSYWREMVDSWLRKSDARYFAMLNSWAVAATAGGDLFEAVGSAMAHVEDETDTTASFVIVNPADVRALIGQTQLEKSAWLTELGIDVGSFVRYPGVPAGTVIAGVRQGGVFREAGVPIRVQAIDVAHGGIDAGLFGYLAGNLVKSGAIAKATFA